MVLYKIVYISLSWFHSFFFIFKENVERFLQQLPPHHRAPTMNLTN